MKKTLTPWRDVATIAVFAFVFLVVVLTVIALIYLIFAGVSEINAGGLKGLFESLWYGKGGSK